MSSSVPPRVVVFAYSDVGYVCLEHLLDCGVKVVALFSHEDDPSETRWYRSTVDLAKLRGVPVHTPESLRDPRWEQLLREELRPDLIFSFYYRQMIPTRLLELAPLGAVNMHGSLLPAFRGRAPVNWAIVHGATETGASLHHMVKEADAGDLVDQEAVPIGPEETAEQVFWKVRDAALLVLSRQLDALLAGRAPRHPQDHARATCFGGRRPADGRLDWNRPAQDLFNLVRAVTRPFPGAFFDLTDGPRLMVWRAVAHPTWPGAPAHAAPGRVLSSDPLVVATGEGVLEMTDTTAGDLSSPDPALPRPLLSVGLQLPL